MAHEGRVEGTIKGPKDTLGVKNIFIILILMTVSRMSKYGKTSHCMI